MQFSTSSLPELLALERMIYSVKFLMQEDDATEFLGSKIIAAMGRQITALHADLLKEEGRDRELRRLEAWLVAENHPHVLDRVRSYLQLLPGWDDMASREQEEILQDVLSPLHVRPETLKLLREKRG